MPITTCHNCYYPQGHQHPPPPTFLSTNDENFDPRQEDVINTVRKIMNITTSTTQAIPTSENSMTTTTMRTILDFSTGMPQSNNNTLTNIIGNSTEFVTNSLSNATTTTESILDIRTNKDEGSILTFKMNSLFPSPISDNGTNFFTNATTESILNNFSNSSTTMPDLIESSTEFVSDILSNATTTESILPIDNSTTTILNDNGTNIIETTTQSIMTTINEKVTITLSKDLHGESEMGNENGYVFAVIGVMIVIVVILFVVIGVMYNKYKKKSHRLTGFRATQFKDDSSCSYTVENATKGAVC